VAIAVAVMSIVELVLASGFARTEASFGTRDLDIEEIVRIVLVWYFAQMGRLDSCLSFQFTKHKVVRVNYSVEIHPGQENQDHLPYHGESLLWLQHFSTH
jgi:hypothetical protein